MYENLIEIWWKNEDFECAQATDILYKGILVVGAYYDKMKNLMKKWCQKGPKIDAKITILAIRGPTFEVLGHVFGQTFFNNFEATQTSTKKLKNATKNKKKNADAFFYQFFDFS